MFSVGVTQLEMSVHVLGTVSLIFYVVKGISEYPARLFANVPF